MPLRSIHTVFTDVEYNEIFKNKEKLELNWHDFILFLNMRVPKVRSKRKSKNKNKRKPLDTRLRHECFKRDGYKCLECGATKEEKVLHADHIIPVSQGGSDELSNLQTLCDDCNFAKSNKAWIGG